MKTRMEYWKAAPGSARLVADLLTGAAPIFDPAPFRAERF